MTWILMTMCLGYFVDCTTPRCVDTKTERRCEWTCYEKGRVVSCFQTCALDAQGYPMMCTQECYAR